MMKKNLLNFIVSICIIFICSFCEKSPLDMFIKEGEIKLEARKIEAFEEIYINDIFDIEIINGTNPQIEIEAGKNILPFIKTTNEGNRLILTNEIKSRWAREYRRPKIKLLTQNLKKIYINEACYLFNNDTLKINRLEIYTVADMSEIKLTLEGKYLYLENKHTTSGRYELKGHLDAGFLFSGGTAIIDAFELAIDTASFYHNSIADMKVRVDKYLLDLRTFRAGNIYIKGSPEIIHMTEIKDSARVIYLE